jgi:hypothetical protein
MIIIRNCAAATAGLLVATAACGPAALAPPDLDADTRASLPGRWQGPGGDLVLTADGLVSRNFTEGAASGTALSGRWTGTLRRSGASSTGAVTIVIACGGGGPAAATIAAQLRHEPNDFVNLDVQTVNGKPLENGLLSEGDAGAITKDVPAGKREAVRNLIESLSAAYLACTGCAGTVPASACP